MAAIQDATSEESETKLGPKEPVLILPVGALGPASMRPASRAHQAMLQERVEKAKADKAAAKAKERAAQATAAIPETPDATLEQDAQEAEEQTDDGIYLFIYFFFDLT